MVVESDQVSSPLVEHELTADGFRIRYLSGGGEGDPLVLVHGGDGILPTDEATLRLTAGHRVFVVEMPGWSQENLRTTTLREMAHTIGAAIAGLEIGELTLIGTSVGAPVVLWTAIDSGLPIKAIVLESPAAFRGGGPAFAGGPPKPEVFNYQVAKQRERVIPSQTMSFMMRLAPPGVNDPALEAAIADLRVPVLTIFGDRDGLVPPEVFARFYRIPPLSKVVLVADAAHDVKGDRPEAFVDLVTTFLASGIDAVPSRVS